MIQCIFSTNHSNSGIIRSFTVCILHSWTLCNTPIATVADIRVRRVHKPVTTFRSISSNVIQSSRVSIFRRIMQVAITALVEVYDVLRDMFTGFRDRISINKVVNVILLSIQIPLLVNSENISLAF